MRPLGLRSLLLLSGVLLAPVVACSSSSGETSDEQDITNLELGKKALAIMGAPGLSEPGQQSCGYTGCHSINPVTLNLWKRQFDEAKTMLESNASRDKKINFFRQNPRNERTQFTPERIGIYAAGAHLKLGANVNEQDHPRTYAQGKLFSRLFEGKPELYAEFQREMLMPVLPDFPRLTASDYETVITWFEKGMPKLDELIREERPERCVDNITKLRERTIAMKSKTWAARNQANGLPMFACPAPIPSQPVSPTACFTQKRDGKDVFPAKEWGLDGSTVRILREFSAPNSYWTRSSADGRFAATGGGRDSSAQAMDLQATLEGQTRDIGLDAEYDPDFWPDNKAFMFQGGTKFCAQSLLEKPSTTNVSFDEPECSNLSQAEGLYQTVGQVVGDNSLSDRFILYSIWAGDSGDYSSSARDTEPQAGADAAINIFTAIAKGNDVEEGYQVRGAGAKVLTPYRGDTMMARSGTLIGSRWAFKERGDGTKDYGYKIEGLKRSVSGGNSSFQLEDLGDICMRGNKANISFDERFLATHHYNEPGDFSASDDPAYREKGSADLVVADFITGKKATITKLGPGQFALYPHFRSDGWLYFLVVDHNTDQYMMVASDWAVRQAEANPTP